MRGNRLFKANHIARKLWKKYHQSSVEWDKSWYGEADLTTYPDMGAYRKTKVLCSSPYCCGNPRKIHGKKHLTKQELLAELATIEQLEDLYGEI